jgi:hydroxymethylpyrimidine/phosphomethylpyrimidine kinase
MALTIAGSDSGGGAGIQADIKTFSALGVFGCTAITAITAQNTCGVDGIWPLPPDAIAAQIHSVLNDLPIKSIKTGMLYQPSVVDALLGELAQFNMIPLVVDPVLVATSGDALFSGSLLSHECYWTLLKSAYLVTPNLYEAAQLLQTDPATSTEDMLRHGRGLIDAGLQAVLIKGGHLRAADSSANNFPRDMVDILLWREGGTLRHREFRAKQINTSNTHGTGCTLSAAITAELAKGQNLIQSIDAAKGYLTEALEHAARLQFGSGNGPVHHFFHLHQL